MIQAVKAEGKHHVRSSLPPFCAVTIRNMKNPYRARPSPRQDAPRVWNAEHREAGPDWSRLPRNCFHGRDKSVKRFLAFRFSRLDHDASLQ